jgi:hypothetical protein
MKQEQCSSAFFVPNNNNGFKPIVKTPCRERVFGRMPYARTYSGWVSFLGRADPARTSGEIANMFGGAAGLSAGR